MAGTRLEYWQTLNREELVRRISLEEVRGDLTFPEQQCLDAARERLLKWRAPSKRRPEVTQQEKPAAESTETKAAETKTDASETKKPETTAAEAKASETAVKPAKKTPAKKAAPKQKPTPSAEQPKESEVAKKAKTAKSAKTTNGTGGKRVSEDAVLRVNKGFKNPYKEGTGPFKRFEIMAKSAGKTYATLRAMASLKPTTALNFVRAGGGSFELKGK